MDASIIEFHLAVAEALRQEHYRTRTYGAKHLPTTLTSVWSHDDDQVLEWQLAKYQINDQGALIVQGFPAKTSLRSIPEYQFEIDLQSPDSIPAFLEFMDKCRIKARRLKEQEKRFVR